MEHQRTQPELFFRQIRQVRTVRPAADPDNAVEISSRSGLLDLLDLFLENFPSGFVWLPFRQHALIKSVAVIAPPLPVKRNLRIGRVHHAICADLVFSHVPYSVLRDSPVTEAPRRAIYNGGSHSGALGELVVAAAHRTLSDHHHAHCEDRVFLLPRKQVAASEGAVFPSGYSHPS